MRSRPHPSLVFAVIFVAVFLLHAPLLQLPYFWDEAGYYVPAARDILLSGSLIPHTTVSNAHPPLVLAWVALWWKSAGYAPLVARSAMLLVAAFSLLGVYRLAEFVANRQVALASTVCTALYPVFFAQSSLVQVDLAAAGLTFWGLAAYLEGRAAATVVWFSLAVLTKETAILAPVALAGWEVLKHVWSGRPRPLVGSTSKAAGQGARSTRVVLLFPLLPLALWYGYHYLRTGYVFGNPEFFRYNVAATLNPLRFVLALLLRLWQAFGYMHLWLLTLTMLMAMLAPPLSDGAIERRRIAIPIQIVFFVVVAAYVIAMALIGGAVLARYMLPAVPLVVILAVSTLRRRLRYWPAAVGGIALTFVMGWFLNPPYGFSPEDNLAYRDYVLIHEDAECFLEAQYPMAHVLTAWPASDELTRPWLGYMSRPMQVVRIEDFSLEQMVSAADFRSHFEVALVFSTKYQPPHPLLARWQTWTELKRRFFGFHVDLPPAAAAQILGGHVVFSEERKGQWVAVIEMEQQQIFNARNLSP
ncbi:MAG TPA: glycosyltransferase family 39 protein [Candidatus Binatia bacterium]|nr:glycosyltransferase family 39 protein [Candidatus Binatia bacterium]